MPSVTLKTLLIAPDGDLANVDAEIAAVTSALHCTVLRGSEATGRAVRDALNETWDLVWFAAHGVPGGIVLYGGEIMPADELIPCLRGNVLVGLYLNTCQSLKMAVTIRHEIRAPIICTLIDVPDHLAYATGALLARMLARGHDLKQAFQLSEPAGERKYLYLNGDVHGNTDRLDDLLVQLHQATNHLSRRIEESMAELESTEQRMNVRIDKIEHDIGRRFDEMSDDLRSNYQLRLMRGNATKWTLGFFLFTISVWLFYSDVRAALEINAITAGILAMVLLPTSAWLFMSGMGFSFDTTRKDITQFEEGGAK